jgi:hypothetical protein
MITTTETERTKSTKAPWVMSVVAIVLSALALVQPASQLITQWTVHNPSASISAPRNGATVRGAHQEIRGNAENIPGDHDLWLVIRPSDPGDFYPVTRLSVQNGSWEVPADDAVLSGVGQFALLIYLTDSQASSSLSTFLKKQHSQTSNSPTGGMISLPAGMTLEDSATVSRSS